MTDEITLLRELRERFGHESFRTGQLDVLRSVLDGTPTLAVMPTGAGKSLLYQLPSLMLPGVTVVVSPLLALMKDQVDELRRRSIPAAYINSSQSEIERSVAERELASGKYRLVYVAPERFRNATFRRSLAQIEVSLLAIDEAHCVSEWGHAFRPDYERLGEAIADIKAARVLALTATATAQVRADIIRALKWKQPTVIVTGFDRPNLHLEFHELGSDAEKDDSVVGAVRDARPAIVYAATRRQAMSISRLLVMNGIRAAAYHAGLPNDQRQWAQEAFIRGDLDAVAATNAFGLGIDKSDVRLVIHATIPRSVDAWYQEAGRAGRDGKDATAALFFTLNDIYMRRRLLVQATPAAALVQAIHRKIAAAGSLTLDQISSNLPSEASGPRVSATLGFLESIGAITHHFGGEDRYTVTRGRSVSEDDLRLLKMRGFRDRQRLERMVALARRPICRRRALLRELGELGAPERCSACDVCTGAQLRPTRSRLGMRSGAAWDMSAPLAALSLARKAGRNSHPAATIE